MSVPGGEQLLQKHEVVYMGKKGRWFRRLVLLMLLILIGIGVTLLFRTHRIKRELF